MAVQHSIGRIPSILLLALLGLAVVAGAASYLSRPEPETAPAAQITATAPVASPAEATQGQVTVARLVVEPQVSPARQDPATSMLRPRNMAPIPKRAPRAATAGTNAARSVAALFQSGTEIKIRKDAIVYITSRNIPENDRLLEAYDADRSNGGRDQTRFGKASAIPGLLGIANQAHRAGDPNGQNDQAYSLADAMRDAIWRMNTSARLKYLTASQSACADGAAGKTPSIGLIVIC